MDYDPQLQQGKWGLQLSNVPHFLLTSRAGILIPAIPGAEAGEGGLADTTPSWLPSAKRQSSPVSSRQV